MKKILLRLAKYTGLTLVSILLLMFLWPIVFPGTAARQIKQWVNANIDGELNFSEARLSFFRHFPTLTLTLHDFSLTGSAPFERDTLLAGDGDVVADIFRTRVVNRGKGAEVWGWGTAYGTAAKEGSKS